MKRIFLILALALAASTAFPQNNLKVVKYILLDAEPKKKTELKFFKVPEDEVWKIESAIGEYSSQNINLVINDQSYIIQMTPREKFTEPKLPFYLPGGTEFQLGAREDKGIVSICVLKIE
jgi:hypothetical protein